MRGPPGLNSPGQIACPAGGWGELAWAPSQMQTAGHRSLTPQRMYRERGGHILGVKRSPSKIILSRRLLQLGVLCFGWSGATAGSRGLSAADGTHAAHRSLLAFSQCEHLEQVCSVGLVRSVVGIFMH